MLTKLLLPVFRWCGCTIMSVMYMKACQNPTYESYEYEYSGSTIVDRRWSIWQQTKPMAGFETGSCGRWMLCKVDDTRYVRWTHTYVIVSPSWWLILTSDLKVSCQLVMWNVAFRYARDWRYHKEERVWITRMPGVEPTMKTANYERGTYYFFDCQNWRKAPKEFHLDYEKLEDRPILPPLGAPAVTPVGVA